jgi:hypothetical protein
MMGDRMMGDRMMGIGWTRWTGWTGWTRMEERTADFNMRKQRERSF